MIGGNVYPYPSEIAFKMFSLQPKERKMLLQYQNEATSL